MKRLFTVLALIVVCNLSFAESPLDRVKRKDDKFSKTTFYESKGMFFKYLDAYIVQKEGSAPVLKVSFYYQGNHWIFFDRIQLVHSGEDPFTVIYDSSNYKRKILDGSTVREWVTITAYPELIEYLRAFFQTEKPMARFSGEGQFTRKYYKVELSPVIAVFDAYDFLLQNYNPTSSPE